MKRVRNRWSVAKTTTVAIAILLIAGSASVGCVGASKGLAAVGRAQSRSLTSSSRSVIESRIDGTFNGWDGETVFKLVNGQIWQQSRFAFKFAFKFRPKVTIYPSGAGHKMIVDGVGTIAVRQIK
jgi:hypothetical protein